MAFRTFGCFGLGLAALTLPGMATAQKVQILKSADYTLQVTELNSGLKSP